MGDCLWSLISGLQQSHRQPLPPVSIPSGLVIKSLIIHHYSNHYLPFPGPQCWLCGIQSGSLHHPASSETTTLQPSLPTRATRRRAPSSTHAGTPQSQRHLGGVDTRSLTNTVNPIKTCIAWQLAFLKLRWRLARNRPQSRSRRWARVASSWGPGEFSHVAGLKIKA